MSSINKLAKKYNLPLTGDEIMDAVSDYANEHLTNSTVDCGNNVNVTFIGDSEDDKYDYYITQINNNPCKIGFCT